MPKEPQNTVIGEEEISLSYSTWSRNFDVGDEFYFEIRIAAMSGSVSFAYGPEDDMEYGLTGKENDVFGWGFSHGVPFITKNGERRKRREDDNRPFNPKKRFTAKIEVEYGTVTFVANFDQNSHFNYDKVIRH